MPMSRGDMRDLRSASRGAHDYIARLRDESGIKPTKGLGSFALTLAEVGAGAVAAGWLTGRTGTTSVPGTSIPLGPTVTLAAFAASWFGALRFLGKYESHALAFLSGPTVAWLAMLGVGYGSNAAGAAGTPHSQVSVGGVAGPSYGAPPPVMGARGRSPLSEAELQALASSVPSRRVA
jgi:hypothetical protein